MVSGQLLSEGLDILEKKNWLENLGAIFKKIFGMRFGENSRGAWEEENGGPSVTAEYRGRAGELRTGRALGYTPPLCLKGAGQQTRLHSNSRGTISIPIIGKCKGKKIVMYLCIGNQH